MSTLKNSCCGVVLLFCFIDKGNAHVCKLASRKNLSRGVLFCVCVCACVRMCVCVCVKEREKQAKLSASQEGLYGVVQVHTSQELTRHSVHTDSNEMDHVH